MGRLFRIGFILTAATLVGLLAAGPLVLSAQESSPPPQEKKKEEKKKARKVWTNDDIPSLQKSRGVSVVGTARPAEAAKPAEAKAKPVEKNFYSDLSMEERAEWIAMFEQEIAEAEAQLVELRSRALSATNENDRAVARQQIVGLEQAVEANRREIELIRNTPEPAPAKLGQPAKPKTETPAAPAPQEQEQPKPPSA